MSKKSNKKKSDKDVSIIEAAKKLKETEDLLLKKQLFLEQKIEEELDHAKSTCIKSKGVAMQSLRKKRRLENQLRRLDGTLTTIEMQREALESASTNTTVLVTMRTAADALKMANNHLSVDKVNDMVDDIAEQHDIAKEIAEAFNQNAALQQNVDEEELEKELEQLEQEALNDALLHVGPSTSLGDFQTWPSIPTQVCKTVENQETDRKGGKEGKVTEGDEEDGQDVEKLRLWAN